MKEKILIVEDQFIEADYLRSMLIRGGYHVCDIARSVLQAQEILKRDKPRMVLLDIFLKGKATGIDLAHQLKKDHIAFIYLSANSNQDILTQVKPTEPYGFLVKPFKEKDLLVALEIAQYRMEFSLESRLHREEILQKRLGDIFMGKGNWRDKLLALSRNFQPYFPFDYLSAGLINSYRDSSNETGFLRIGFNEYQYIGREELYNITGITSQHIRNSQPQGGMVPTSYFRNADFFKEDIKKNSLTKLIAEAFKVNAQLVFLLRLHDGQRFHFHFYSKNPNAYTSEHIAVFDRIEVQLVKGLDTIFVADRHQDSALNTESTENFDGTGFSIPLHGIVGRSHLLLKVIDHARIVAPTDTSVLVLGESGTGKEKIAHCIHNLSSRKERPFVKVNCANLPTNLIESELFGHEKGAFTGAIERRIGKFEQADNGTIFLDEIGELSLELQMKLLAVLQEREIERVGSQSVKKVNVRVIAATNRNLEKEVAEGRFRLDLYYRLNVFPIILPPLRERREDIAALSAHFIQHYNRKTGKKIIGLSDKALKKLEEYHWPGNIRELEHLIERNILLSKEPMIDDIQIIPLYQKNADMSLGSRIKTMEENERDHILFTLEKCNGKIWGAGAAAELLNLHPSTLKSKMKKLGIKKNFTN
ncbi:sigma 54-interacting transcriptional regulator [Flagellimonas pelagia]|uniref:Response regulator n=1 Tax=Flagellimonas pelagia TaxID=2306998 RepID=A0A3A1ND27_9FLAO|nr:sigma 54-interacting transcriptional regulator [Allomuricauda maritima]RIV41952.1 response regulator [Allomuricauda maritima]TXJ90829.1 response regulator [Allomuricauda maritima]